VRTSVRRRRISSGKSPGRFRRYGVGSTATSGCQSRSFDAPICHALITDSGCSSITMFRIRLSRIVSRSAASTVSKATAEARLRPPPLSVGNRTSSATQSPPLSTWAGPWTGRTR
jgi:hypothetical protein